MISDTLLSLLKDPAAYVLLAGAGGLLHFYLKRRITAGVDHQFALRLEDHKQSLRLAAAAAHYQFEHRLSQANLYTANGHAAAVEVYKALRIAHGRCVNLRGFRQDLTFEEFNRADLAEYMSSHQVPQGKQEEILGRLAADRAGVIHDMRAYLRMLEVQEADKLLGQAKNETFLNELYFDDEVIEVINRFFTIMATWMAYIEVPPDASERASVPTRAQMQAALESVHTSLRDRLRGATGDAV